MWAFETSFYQIYTLGFCGAPFENDGILEHRILKVIDWIPYLKKLGIGAIIFNPVFESDTHGYNTRDYGKIDCRLGTNDDFKEVCSALHKENIKVVLDGVFNHCGRGFFGFTDVLKNRENSKYTGWFNINFGGNSVYNDGLWYEGWENNYDIVKFNLRNNEVCDYLMNNIHNWIEDYDIDGLRLDVAHCLDQDFLKRIRRDTDSWKKDFFLVGEIISGDYHQLLGDDKCTSVTNYECYKGLYSSFNSMNMFEIIHSLLREFGQEQWCLYRGEHLLSFVDNHDVTRVASILNVPEHLPLIYAVMFGMPGIPTIYYGSEWGAKGNKSDGDPALRPCFDKPEYNDLTKFISTLCKIKNESEALQNGDFYSLMITNKQCIFERKTDNDRIMIAINADKDLYHADFNANAGRTHDLITGKEIDFGGGLDIPGYTAYFMKPY